MLKWGNSFDSWLYTLKCVAVQNIFHLEPGSISFYIKTIFNYFNRQIWHFHFLHERKKKPTRHYFVSARNISEELLQVEGKRNMIEGLRFNWYHKELWSDAKKRFLQKPQHFRSISAIRQYVILKHYSGVIIRYFLHFRLSEKSAPSPKYYWLWIIT